jgi:hypothetical protein
MDLKSDNYCIPILFFKFWVLILFYSTVITKSVSFCKGTYQLLFGSLKKPSVLHDKTVDQCWISLIKSNPESFRWIYQKITGSPQKEPTLWMGATRRNLQAWPNIIKKLPIKSKKFSKKVCLVPQNEKEPKIRMRVTPRNFFPGSPKQ